MSYGKDLKRLQLGDTSPPPSTLRSYDDTTDDEEANMKIASLVLLATAANGFAPAARPQRASFVTVPRMADTSTPSETSSDFASAMPDAADPYERLGVSKDQVALGVEANEILQWLGT